MERAFLTASSFLNEQDTRGPAHAGSMPPAGDEAAALDSRRSRWRAFARSNVRVAQATPILSADSEPEGALRLPGDEQVAPAPELPPAEIAAEGPAAELSVSQEPAAAEPAPEDAAAEEAQAEEPAKGKTRRGRRKKRSHVLHVRPWPISRASAVSAERSCASASAASATSAA